MVSKTKEEWASKSTHSTKAARQVSQEANVTMMMMGRAIFSKEEGARTDDKRRWRVWQPGVCVMVKVRDVRPVVG